MLPSTLDVAAAAQAYARLGWAVLPLHSARDGACSCGVVACSRVAKHPRTNRGLHDATTDAAQIATWWRRWPTANVGIATGAASGIFVLDVDIAPEKRGDRVLAELVVEHGGAGETANALTGGDGAHYYFTHPGGVVPNSIKRLGAGLDVRGDGGYVVAPPSVHANGQRYVWMDSSAAITPCSAWLLQRVVPPPPAPRQSLPIAAPSTSSVLALDVLVRECSFIRHAMSAPASLSYEEWISLGMILRVFPLGPELFDEISRADPERYHRGEVGRKLASIRGAPRYCTNVGWSCPKLGECASMGVRSPAGLPYIRIARGRDR